MVKEASFVKHFVISCSSPRRSGMARVNNGSHSFTCHPRVYAQVEWAITAFTPKPQSVHRTLAGTMAATHFPSRCRRLSWPRWLGEILTWLARPKTVTHPGVRGGGESNSRIAIIESRVQRLGGSNDLHTRSCYRIIFHHALTALCYTADFGNLNRIEALLWTINWK